MRAITVAVDHSDLLAVTLPRNRRHFTAFTVVTSFEDYSNVEPIARVCDAEVLRTDLFWEGGAAFNKWRALEWGLDCIGREGWLCLIDADVVWPESAPIPPIRVGQLLSPLRRMLENPPVPFEVPPEYQWRRLPIHRNVNEWAGYSQVFHADDPALGPPPWHEVDWRHAGGADSFFQARWRPQDKVRPPWECLHIGPAGQNWHGRATAYLDGRVPAGAEGRREACRRIWAVRHGRRAAGMRGDEVFKPEKL